VEQLADHPYWTLTFDESGKLTKPAAGVFLDGVVSLGVSDLFVMSHGWGDSQTAAQQLYEAMFPLVAAAAGQAANVGPIGFVGIYWPSLWFPDPPPDAPGVADAVAAGKPGAADAALSGQQIAQTLKASYADPGRQDTVEKMGQLIDAGAAAAGAEPPAAQQARLDEFHGMLKNLVTNGEQPLEDSGETSLLRTDDPKTDYAKISDILGSAPEGGAAEGLGDVFSKVWNGAKDAMRAGSYYEMKSRAGTIGHKGLGPLLAQLHAKSPGVRVHLIGHSFGARLVSFALSGIGAAAASPVASLCLVQGAFSHWSFAHLQDMPFGKAGALNEFTDRVHGPLVATFSEHDWAVGQWYPRASFLAQQNAAAEVAPANQWGGMGSDGFQGVTPKGDLDLLPAGRPYQLAPGSFYRVNGSGVIADTKQSTFAGAHSDICHPEVAWLAVAAAAATA